MATLSAGITAGDEDKTDLAFADLIEAGDIKVFSCRAEGLTIAGPSKRLGRNRLKQKQEPKAEIPEMSNSDFLPSETGKLPFRSVIGVNGSLSRGSEKGLCKNCF
jgi:hypothetical protein